MIPSHRILKGTGFWDVTKYPFGGDFRRAIEDTPCQVTGPEYRDFVKVQLDAKRSAYVPKHRLEPVTEGGAQ